jgi:tripartite-type tricarboxylate transporter receptor subunit TctC
MQAGIIQRRQATTFIAAAFLSFALRSALAADDRWPKGNIKVISPFSAGSAADTIARIVMNQVATQVDRSVVVLNRIGSGGTLGNNMVAQAAPDGLTVLATGALPAAAALYENLPYSTLDDLVPVAALGLQPFVLVTNPSHGFKTLNDLIAAAKAKPGSVTYSSGGIGSATHFAAERLRISANFEALHVPFRGAQDGVIEVFAGRVDFMYLPTAAAFSLIKGKQLRALAVSSSKRSTLLPDIPTTEELGLANSAYNWWAGLWLPAKTPRDIVVRFHEEVVTALKAPAVQSSLTKLGVEPMPMSLDEVAAYFRKDVQAHIKLAKDAKMPTQKQ